MDMGFTLRHVASTDIEPPSSTTAPLDLPPHHVVAHHQLPRSPSRLPGASYRYRFNGCGNSGAVSVLSRSAESIVDNGPSQARVHVRKVEVTHYLPGEGGVAGL